MTTDVWTADREFCRAILPEVSRTFALGIRLLPPSLSWTVSIAYLICRLADTIEDNAALPIPVRRAMLAELDAALAGPARGLSELPEGPWPPAERALMLSSDRVLREYGLLADAERRVIARWVGEMIRGMSESLSSTGPDSDTPFAGMADLHRYCYFVAGTVGHMLTDLFRLHSGRIDARRHARLDGLASDFGLGLQLTNVTRDLADDMRDGRNFVPAELWRRAGLAPADLFRFGLEAESWQIAEPLLADASTHLGQALAYCCTLPRSEVRLRFFCFTSLIFAARTLTLIQRRRDDFARGSRIKMSRPDVYRLLAISFLCVPSNTLLRVVFRAAETQGSRRATPG